MSEIQAGLKIKNDIEQNSFWELFHGFIPWAAHNALTWGSFAILSTKVSPFIAPISFYIFYPLQTIWVRMALEAGCESKQHKSSY